MCSARWHPRPSASRAAPGWRRSARWAAEPSRRGQPRGVRHVAAT
jgi:hypothetical protein